MSTGPYAATGTQAEGRDTRSNAERVAGDAQDTVQQVAGQAQEKAQQAAGQAKSRLREQLDQRSSQAAGQINEQVSDLRAVSESLREQGKDGPAQVAERLAGYGERVGSYLRDRDSDALLADVEDLGRRQPWALAAGGLALGVAASRFLKASSRQRYSSRYGGETSSAVPRTGAPGMATGSPSGVRPPAVPTSATEPPPVNTGSGRVVSRPPAGATEL